MLKKNTKYLFFTGLISLIVWGCGSSAEYTTAKMAIDREDWPKAEEFLLKALEVEPENPEVLVQIGYRIHAKKGEWIKMNEIFDRAMAIDPEKKILKVSRPVKEMIKNYRGMFWAENYNNSVRLFNQYKKNEDKSVLEEATKMFETTVIIDPEEGQTYAILASCHYELGHYELAVNNGKKSVELIPNDLNTNLALGQILSQIDRKEEALPYIIKAVEVDPSSASAIRSLATIYYELNQKEKSVETFEIAIKTETDNKLKSDLYFNLGVLNMQLDNFQEAEDAFLFAFDLNPEDTEALVGMAQTFENAEKWRRAAKFYRELITLEPENPEHFKGMARVLIKQGDPNGATRYYNKAKKLGG